jgi:hypothetical protein
MAADALSRHEEETTTMHEIYVTTFQLFEAFYRKSRKKENKFRKEWHLKDGP